MTMGIKELFLGTASKHGKLPGPYEPKLVLRLTDERSKQIVEFGVEVPKEGADPELVERILSKLQPILQRMGYSPAA